MPFRSRLTDYKRHFAGDNGLTLFEREDGVVCIEAPGIIPNRRTVDDLWGFIHTLEASGLEWIWESEDSEVPAVLTCPTQEALIAELQKRDENHFWQRVTLVGVDVGFARQIASPDTFAAEVRRFAEVEEGPIRVVIFQIGDTREQQIFLPHERVPGVDAMLARFGVDPDSVTRKRRYRPSSGITLEALYRALE